MCLDSCPKHFFMQFLEYIVTYFLLFPMSDMSKMLILTIFLFCLRGLNPETNRWSKVAARCMTLTNMIMILMVFLGHNANTVNHDSDDDGCDDDDDNDRAPSDGAGAVDAADDCGNEHVDKAETFSLSMHGS